MITTIFGKTFLIETDGISRFDEAAAERVEQAIEAGLEDLAADEIDNLHSLALQAQDGEIEWDHPELATLDEVATEAVLNETADWHDNGGCSASVAAQ